MSNPCEGCAFTKGATANLEPDNNIRSQLCLLGGIPFYCHHAKDGSVQDHGGVTPAERRTRIQAGRMVICQGWRREVKELVATGYYDRVPDLKRAFAKLGLGALAIFCNSDDAAEKEEAARNLKNVILALNKARGFEVVEVTA